VVSIVAYTHIEICWVFYPSRVLQLTKAGKETRSEANQLI